MALRFVFGRAGSGKSRFCLEEVRSLAREDPLGVPLILLVPEQASYQMEVQLASSLGGMMRAQVLSFRRLAWRVLSEAGGGQRPLLGELGKRMLIRRILLAHRSELKTLARSAVRPGMADSLARMIGEFKAYSLEPGDLRQAALDVSPRLQSKLDDLALIYSEFQRLAQGLNDPDDQISFAGERLSQAHTGRGALIWVDGFKGFTPQELTVLAELMTLSPEITVALPLDPAVWERATRGEEPLLPQHEMFAPVWQTVLELQRLAAEQGVELAKPLLLKESRRFQVATLQHLERFYGVYPIASFPQDKLDEDRDDGKGIRLAAAVNRRVEVQGVAREILRLVREQGWRWRDILVLTRDLALYASLLEDTFALHEIPLFLDYKRNVIHHPLVEFLLSAIEIARSDWAFEPVFRCLKTGFFPLPVDTIDRLENYCLAHGIHGEAWLREAPWTYRRRWTLSDNQAEELTLKQMDEARRLVAQLLGEFTQRLKEEGLSVRELVETLYVLLEKMDIPGQLSAEAKTDESKGELDEALVQEQLWQGVIDVLDEMVAGLGNTLMSLDDFSQVLASGLESLELGIIPPSLDQVQAGSIERSRNPEVKAVFLLGVNEGVIPARPSFSGVLDASDREELEKKGLLLSPGLTAQLLEEQFYIYFALTRAAEVLYLSYAQTDADGKGLAPSHLIKQVKALFPGLEEEIWRGTVETPDDLAHPQAIWQDYALQLHLPKEKMPPFWQAVREWLHADPRYSQQLAFLENEASNYKREEKLSTPLARRLYGRPLRVSVSRLEEFIRCPFGHYARYGLRLKERSRYTLANPDLGQFFHRLLYDFAQTVREKGLRWGELSPETSWQILGELTDRIAPELQNEILLSSARYRYITRKLKRTAHQAVKVLGEHARRGRFVPISLELRFGDRGMSIPQIELGEGDSLALVGQIDRIDALAAGGKVYLRITDYKSHSQTLSLDKVYYGLNLQLLAYLDVALRGAQVLVAGAAEQLGVENRTEYEAKAAGFLYFPVVFPELDGKMPLAPEEIERQRLKAMRVDGYLLADTEILLAMDEELISGQSNLLGLRINKDGSFRQGSKVLNTEQFELLRLHLQNILKQAGREILDGEIRVKPFKMGQASGCDYCAYRPVCHFEVGQPSRAYRVLPALKGDAVFSLIKNASANEKDESGSILQASAERAKGSAKDANVAWLGDRESEEERKEEKHGR